MGIILGLLILGGGIYMSFKGVFPWYKVPLPALVAALYINAIPFIMDGSFKLIRPLFIGFHEHCAKRAIGYEIVIYFRSIGITFARGTPLADRFKLGLLFNLIFFLQVLTLISVFGVALFIMFLLGSLM